MGLLKSSLHGHANKLRATNPPSFTRQPYNTVTLGVTYGPGSSSQLTQTITTGTIVDLLKAQLGLTASGLRVKIQRADFWAMPSEGISELAELGINPQVTGKFYSLVELNGNTSGVGATVYPVALKELDDTGINGQSAAVVSYSWPRDQADMPLGKPEAAGGTPGTIAELAAPLGVKVFARFHVHWSTIGTDDIATRYSTVQQ
jgi:hypothetical protein